MVRSLPEYLTRGGTKSAIAESWGKTRQQVGNLVKDSPENFLVEFNPLNPKRVLKFWQVLGDKVYFEAEA